jgi:hypothetical protein
VPEEGPPFDAFWNELPALFAWLTGGTEPRVLPVYPFRDGEQLITASLGRLGLLGRSGRPLESIRFAGANRLCIELDYHDEEGTRAIRTIEPYSLRSTAEGHTVLHAERSDGSGHRTYRVDRIVDARVTDTPFTPKYAIELTPGAQQNIPDAKPRTRTTVAQSGTKASRWAQSTSTSARSVESDSDASGGYLGSIRTKISRDRAAPAARAFSSIQSTDSLATTSGTSVSPSPLLADHP